MILKKRNNQEKKELPKIAKGVLFFCSGILIILACMLVPKINIENTLPAYEDEYIKIPKYAGIAVKHVDKPEITEEDIEERFQEVIAAEAQSAGVETEDFVFDDAYVAAMKSSDYSNIKEFKEFLKTTLEEERDATFINTISTYALDEIMSNTTVKKYPEGSVDKQKEEVIADEKIMADEDYVSFDDYLYSTYGVTTEDEYGKIATESAEYIVKQKLITDAILSQEEINLKKEDMDEIYANYAVAYEVTIDEIKSEEWSEWMDWVTYNKEDWILRKYLTSVTKIAK